jgi:hypothetical protein
MLKHHSSAKSGHSIIKKKQKKTNKKTKQKTKTKKLCETCALSAYGEYTHLLQKTEIVFS